MLNQTMLSELKEVIFEKCNLPESVKEPVHITCKILSSMEYAYEDFLSREVCGENKRANVVRELITLHGGETKYFDEWFSRYEPPVVEGVESRTATVKSSWGS